MPSKSAVRRIRSAISSQALAHYNATIVHDSQSFASSQQRSSFIQICLNQGGKPFVERVKKYGCNEKGEPLRLTQSFLEYLEAIGDFRIHHTLTTGVSQHGKTLGHTLLLVDTGVHGKLNTGWFYASRDSRELNVQEQFRPTVEAWIDRLQSDTGEQIGIEGDRKLNSRYQVDGTTFIFSYTSTSKRTPGRDGLAAAGGAAVSFTANVLFYEERSQWLPGTADPLIRRLDASLIPTRPIRELGTPGAGQGIEAELEQVDYYFYPHYTCEECGITAPIDPKGCLLKPITRTLPSGDVKRSYLSESGRPLQWWSKNGVNSVDGAYFGCVECGHPISDHQRVEEAWFQCKQTGVTLRRFLDELPPGVPRSPIKIGLHISPLTRQTKYNLAATIIRDGLTCLRTEDWQQQGLGHPSENVQNSVSLEVIKSAITASKPTDKPVFTLAGIDQGRSEDWLMIVDFYVPEYLYRLSVAEIIDQSVRVVRFGGDVTRDAIPGLLQTYNVEYGLIDNEPDRTSNANLCTDTCLELADQRSGLMDAVKAGIVHDSGREYPCWYIRNEKFLKQVLNGFVLNDEHGYPLYRLPEEWEKWLGTPTERSPIKHLMGPSYDNETGKWKRGKGNMDDLYYALMFCEAAFYLSLTEKNKKTGADLLW